MSAAGTSPSPGLGVGVTSPHTAGRSVSLAAEAVLGVLFGPTPTRVELFKDFQFGGLKRRTGSRWMERGLKVPVGR